MSCDAVEEPPIVTHNHDRSRKVFNRLLETAQCVDIEVVCGLVEHEQVASLLQRTSKLQPVPFAATQGTHLLALVVPLEVEPRAVRACIYLSSAEIDKVHTLADALEHRLVSIQFLATLVDVHRRHRLSHLQFTRIRRFLVDNHSEKGAFPGAVRTYDPDDASGWNVKIQIIDEQAVAVRFRKALRVYDDIAQTRARGNDDVLERRVARVLCRLRNQFIVACGARLSLLLLALR
mmetsp:Transcript_12434/g.33079  ORF Transcript_12434/g.33079 Transcript_12434/m.33079 type:complete len:234 (-) Transcript_12434:276-977(-)